MTIDTEKQFYAKMKSMLNEGRITQEEYDALTDYVCGIIDALTCYGMDDEEDCK